MQPIAGRSSTLFWSSFITENCEVLKVVQVGDLLEIVSYNIEDIDDMFYSLFRIFNQTLTLSWRRSLSYWNQSTDWLKSMEWFLYDRNLLHVRVKVLHECASQIEELCMCLSIFSSYTKINQLVYYLLMYCNQVKLYQAH